MYKVRNFRIQFLVLSCFFFLFGCDSTLELTSFNSQNFEKKFDCHVEEYSIGHENSIVYFELKLKDFPIDRYSEMNAIKMAISVYKNFEANSHEIKFNEIWINYSDEKLLTISVEDLINVISKEEKAIKLMKMFSDKEFKSLFGQLSKEKQNIDQELFISKSEKYRNNMTYIDNFEVYYYNIYIERGSEKRFCRYLFRTDESDEKVWLGLTFYLDDENDRLQGVDF